MSRPGTLNCADSYCVNWPQGRTTAGWGAAHAVPSHGIALCGSGDLPRVVDVPRDCEPALAVEPPLVPLVLLPDVALVLGPDVQPGAPQEDPEGLGASEDAA